MVAPELIRAWVAAERADIDDRAARGIPHGVDGTLEFTIAQIEELLGCESERGRAKIAAVQAEASAHILARRAAHSIHAGVAQQQSAGIRPEVASVSLAPRSNLAS